MSYTNHTTNYNLPQYIGTDKPTYLGDFNTAMGAIDTQMKANADAATTAGTTATAASNAIGALANLTTTDKTSLVNAINEVDTKVDTAQTTATSAGNLASQAKTEADTNAANIAKFNLTQQSTLTVTVNRGTLASSTDVRFATDATDSIFKVYGRINIESLSSQSGNLTVSLGTTSLRPSTGYGINCGAMAYRQWTDGHSDVVPCRLNIKTTGEITITRSTADDYFMTLSNNVQYATIMLPPCLYFNSDFGD